MVPNSLKLHNYKINSAKTPNKKRKKWEINPKMAASTRYESRLNRQTSPSHKKSAERS
jgi:hypothetical protein